MISFGLYVHVPFCAQICPYCAFVSVAGGEELYDRYVEAVRGEIEAAGRFAYPGPLNSLFFGGGTPSTLTPQQLERILAAAVRHLGLAADAEVTIEVNPGTADQTKFSRLRALGFNRLSIGVQSFRDEGLKRLGRVHSAEEGERAYEMARRAGFDNVSLDLISGIPGLPAEQWCCTLERSVELGPEHISAYALTIEDETFFAECLRQGDIEPVSEEEEAQVYEWTSQRLTAAGYEHYEVSNFALTGRRSRHNWGYWTGAEYLGVGVAAHSFIDGRRSWNTRDLMEYIERLESGRSVRTGWEDIDELTANRERVWMGLRTDRGIVIREAERRFLEQEKRFGDLLESGCLEWAGNRLRPTRNGFLLADALGLEISELLEKGVAEREKVDLSRVRATG